MRVWGAKKWVGKASNGPPRKKQAMPRSFVELGYAPGLLRKVWMDARKVMIIEI